ncbi:TPA: hypothetical protein ACP32N_005051 [Pseudomonas aeruginosa]
MLTPANDIARNLLQRLDTLGLRDKTAPGLYGSAHYCIGVRVTNLIEVFELGLHLGAAFGRIRVENYSSEHIIAFPEALVEMVHGSA